MLKKSTVITILMALALILPSCNAVKKDAVNSPNIQQNVPGNIDRNNPDGMNYEINKATFINKEIKINYPQVSNLSDEAKQKDINEMIKKDALREYKDADVNYSLEINYEIKWKSANLLSIQYTGVGYGKGAEHPNNVFYTTNIDMKKGVRVRLQDIVKIDEALTKKIKEGKYTRSSETPELDSAIKDKLNRLSTEELQKKFIDADSPDIGSYSDTFSYFSQDSLGISISVSHAIGDHAEFELKYQDIVNNIKAENEVWKDFPSLAQPPKTEVKENLDDLKKNGLEIIGNQSFEVELEKWGKVKFVTATLPANPRPKLVFYLADDKGTVLYSFLDFVEYPGWLFSEVRAVAFRDVNKDGLKDIIIIADYMTGVGKTGAIPFHHSKIYFQKEKEFVCVPELDEKINEGQQNEKIDTLMNFVAGKVEGYKLVKKTVNFSTFDINKKYFNDVKSFAELKLKLPQLDGDYDGIPEINKYFVGKEKFFYDELPLEDLKGFNKKVEGEKDNWYRSADYKLEAVLGDIISISADLNGGAGGVGWPGIEGDTFNLNTGKKLSLSDIFKVNKDEYMNYIYNFVSKKIMAEINNNKQKGYGSCYNFEDVYSGKGYESIRNFDPNNFYLTKNALVVFYPKYALAFGAAGPLKFEIPFDSVSDMLVLEVKTGN